MESFCKHLRKQLQVGLYFVGRIFLFYFAFPEMIVISAQMQWEMAIDMLNQGSYIGLHINTNLNILKRIHENFLSLYEPYLWSGIWSCRRLWQSMQPRYCDDHLGFWPYLEIERENDLRENAPLRIPSFLAFISWLRSYNHQNILKWTWYLNFVGGTRGWRLMTDAVHYESRCLYVKGLCTSQIVTFQLLLSQGELWATAIGPSHFEHMAKRSIS